MQKTVILKNVCLSACLLDFFESAAARDLGLMTLLAPVSRLTIRFFHGRRVDRERR